MNLLLIIAALGISFTLVLLSIPPILRIAKAKNLFEPFEERKIHTQLIPPLGGVAIFIGFLFTTIIASYQIDFNSLKFIVLASSIMFFIGLKDDLIVISPQKKFLIQIWAALLLIILGDFRFTNLHGILGLYDINYMLSLSISLFFIIALTNAFNLIDGIDGLASGLGIVGLTTLGTWFTLLGFYEYAIICASLTGGLVAFFLFNVFGHKNKLFMGDTGSLIVGIVIATLIIKFNELNIKVNPTYAVRSAPAISLAIAIVPIIDTLRVISIRMMHKKSPFHADRNHIHHLLLKIFNNHLKATMTLVFFTMSMIGISLILSYSEINLNYQFLIILVTGILSSQIPSVLVNIRSMNTKEKLVKKPASTPVFNLNQWTRFEGSELMVYKGRINRRLLNEQKSQNEKEIVAFEHRS